MIALILLATSMLEQADEISMLYAPIVAKQPTPSQTRQTDAALQTASNWFSMGLDPIEEKLWVVLADIGIDALELKGLKDGFDVRYENYGKVAMAAAKKDIVMIGTVLSSTKKDIDFAFALKNAGTYPELYSMVEIAPKDWNLLPNGNIPWLTLQKLHEKGYVPKEFAPYVKQSEWNATGPICGVDKKTRRWIYLQDREGLPRLDWLSPSFGSLRLAAADALISFYRLGQPILQLDAALPDNAKETMSLTIRKMGGFSAAFSKGGIDALRQSTDLVYDHLTPIAALHALVAEDAEALRITYQMLLDEEIQPKSLIHAMEPFGRAPCDWAELLAAPTKKHRYYEEVLTAEALRRRLLYEDVLALGGKAGDDLPFLTWPETCASLIKIQDLEERCCQILELHVLLAKFFAWQPGVFSLSMEDLLGTVHQEHLYTLGGTFSSQLKSILRARREINLEHATLIDVPTTEQRGLLILRFELPNTYSALVAVNFSKQPVSENLESPTYYRTTAIDLETHLRLNKPLDSTFFTLKIDPLSAKLILFQPKIYR